MAKNAAPVSEQSSLFSSLPDFGQPVEIAPGVFWLTLPLPGPPGHINTLLLRESTGWTVIDTGMFTPDTAALWRQVASDVLAGEPVCNVVITHCHPDHIGMAAWFAEEFGAELYMSRSEWLFSQFLLLLPDAEFGKIFRAFYHDCGGSPEFLNYIEQRGNQYSSMVMPVRQGHKRLVDGHYLKLGGTNWRTITASGHSPEMVTLYCSEHELLFAADQILPGISPNISVWPSEPEENPLKEYLTSLQNYSDLPETTRIFPSHGLPFQGVRSRIEALLQHHDERLQRVLDACATPRTAVDVARMMLGRDVELYQMPFSIGEGLAHLNYLIESGEIVKERRADGVLLYRRR